MVLEVQRFFPALLHRMYILNAPMFFEGIWETEMSISVDKETQKKIVISSSETHDELLEQVDEHELPELYGGLCSCKA